MNIDQELSADKDISMEEYDYNLNSDLESVKDFDQDADIIGTISEDSLMKTDMTIEAVELGISDHQENLVSVCKFLQISVILPMMSCRLQLFLPLVMHQK